MNILAVGDPVIVAIAVLVLVAAIIITSIFRYKADDFVKFWGAVGTVIGLAVGGVGTFFFTKGTVDEKQAQVEQRQAQVEQKQTQLDQAQATLKRTEKERLEIAQQIEELSQALMSDPATAEKLKKLQMAVTKIPPPNT
jgi:uncharacterized protein HemX